MKKKKKRARHLQPERPGLRSIPVVYSLSFFFGF
jgi:hypothetical protein